MDITTYWNYMKTDKEKYISVNKLHEWLQEIQLLLIQELNIFKFIEVKLLRISDERVFHFKAPLYWKVRLPELLYQDGRTRVLKDWLLVPCEWTEEVKIMFFNPKVPGDATCTIFKRLSCVVF